MIKTQNHKVNTYKEYHSVITLVVIGTPTHSHSPPPRTGGGGSEGTLAYGWGVGGVPIPTTGEKA
jgi:hypothetical protein